MSLSDQINRHLKNMNVATIRLKNGLTCEEILRHEADRLKSCIQNRINEFYAEYQPKVYQRTFAFQSSLYVDNFVQIGVSGTSLTIKLRFDENAYHPSLWGAESGYLPSLLNDGWKWHNSNVNIYRLSNFDGYKFLEKAVDDYNQDNPYGIKVNIIKNR